MPGIHKPTTISLDPAMKAAALARAADLAKELKVKMTLSSYVQRLSEEDLAAQSSLGKPRKKVA